MRAKTHAPSEAKLTPLRNMEKLPMALKMERYARGLVTLRLENVIVQGTHCEISLLFVMSFSGALGACR